MLTRVTITGADDRTDVRDLVALSRQFPFVEWGILHSRKRVGSPRFPTEQWVQKLTHAASEWPIEVAVHLCGAEARAVLDGTGSIPAGFGMARRVQLNGWSLRPTRDLHSLRAMTEQHDVEVIFQCQSEHLLGQAAAEAMAVGRASALFDLSGGRGIESGVFPRPPVGLSLGYAGGIGPDNVLGVLKAIGPVEHDFWIDMESRVRITDDALDMQKVEQVLRLTGDAVTEGFAAALCRNYPRNV